MYFMNYVCIFIGIMAYLPCICTFTLYFDYTDPIPKSTNVVFVFNCDRIPKMQVQRLLILLALIIGVLYCIHLLVKDYQALTASRLLRLLFKRDVTAHNISKPHVRWKKILLHDPIQCARYLFCDLGTRQPDNQVMEGFIIMLSLEPQEEDRSPLEVFREAYNRGVMSKRDSSGCRWHYPLCPFKAGMLYDLIYHLLGESNGVRLVKDGGGKTRHL